MMSRFATLTVVTVTMTSLVVLSLMNHFPANEYKPAAHLKFQSPIPQVAEVKNAVFNKNCYDYVNVTAINRCCKMKHYTLPDIMSCATGYAAAQRSQNGNSSEPLHFVLIGDSHIRYIFISLVMRMDGPRRQFKQGGWKDWDHNVEKLLEFTIIHVQTSIEARYLGLPIRFTYYADFFLRSIPNYIQRLEKRLELRPTIVILDSGLHYMVKDGKKQGIPYQRSLIEMAPYVSQLASTVPVIYKITDDIQVSRKNKFRTSLKNINLYNNIARQELQGTGVYIWDSTWTLSIQYNNECQKGMRETPKFYTWKCSDTRHLGYIIVDQYADMIYNSVCNKYLDLDDEYCK